MKLRVGFFRVCCVVALTGLIAGCAMRPKVPSLGPNASALDVTTHHPSVLAAEERRVQARAAQTIAQAELMPEVTLNASASAYLTDNNNNTPRANSSNVGVGVSLPISKAIAAIAGVRVAASNSRAEDEALRSSTNALLVQIAQAVAGLERAEVTAQARRAQLGQLQKFLAEQKGRLRAGDVSRTDLEQIKGRIALSSSQYANAKADAAEAYARLAALVGSTAATHIRVIDPSLYFPNTEADAVEIALRENPTVRETDFRRNAASENVSVATVGLGPEASLSFNVAATDENDINGLNSATDNTNVRFNLSVPLFDGGRRIANMQTKVSEMRETHFNALSTRQTIEADTRTYWSRVDAAIRSLGFAKARRTAAQKALNGIKEARRVGARQTQDVLSAHQELTEARIFESQANYDILVYGHELLSRMGRLGRVYNLIEKS